MARTHRDRGLRSSKRSPSTSAGHIRPARPVLLVVLGVSVTLLGLTGVVTADTGTAVAPSPANGTTSATDYNGQKTTANGTPPVRYNNRPLHGAGAGPVTAPEYTPSAHPKTLDTDSDYAERVIAYIDA